MLEKAKPTQQLITTLLYYNTYILSSASTICSYFNTLISAVGCHWCRLIYILLLLWFDHNSILGLPQFPT
ncbi:hypothetical protein E1A91_D04G012200v1 [Gossypium mustelinum]|uniref:Uncharacterized protein n=1 Tax=Gossypium mustelinum TaxID=34275 RepID=A0A5D2V930_GOSMU|nr:hypothetical protein E1A91_D04G012200v1 [Gossypium mustelinum]